MLRQCGNAGAIEAFGQDAMRIRLFDGPLDIAWKHCARTSDFLADFYAVRIPTAAVKEVRHNVSYLVNELLENAVKFREIGDIVIDTQLESDRFRACVANAVSEERALRFQDLLNRSAGRDPSELLIERIEQNAADPTASGSGLGLLTLMGDYGVQLGWDFRESDAPDRRLVQLATYAVLPLAPGSV